MEATVFYLLMPQKYINSKQKNLKWNHAQYFLRNISKHFAVNSMIKTGLDGYVYNFSVDYNIYDFSDIIDIYKYLMKKNIKYTLDFLKIGCFGESLASNCKRPLQCISLNKRPCQVTTLVNINFNKVIYYLFTVSVNKFEGSFDTIYNSYARVCVPNKVKNVNVKIFGEFETRFLVNMNRVSVNVHWMKVHAIRIKNRIMINAGVSLKN